MSQLTQTPKKFARGNLVTWLAVVVWAAMIFYLSAQPSLTTHLGAWDFILRKSAHMIEFGVLGLLIWRAVRQHGVRNSRSLAAGALLALLYAFSDEYHQRYVPGRVGALRDIGFDLAGIIVAATAVTLIGIMRRQRNRFENN